MLLNDQLDNNQFWSSELTILVNSKLGCHPVELMSPNRINVVTHKRWQRPDLKCYGNLNQKHIPLTAFSLPMPILQSWECLNTVKSNIKPRHQIPSSYEVLSSTDLIELKQKEVKMNTVQSKIGSRKKDMKRKKMKEDYFFSV